MRLSVLELYKRLLIRLSRLVKQLDITLSGPLLQMECKLTELFSARQYRLCKQLINLWRRLKLEPQYKEHMRSFAQALTDVSNTVWGILVLLLSMLIAVKWNEHIGIYFAGVGSTLLGIKGSPNTQTQVNTATDQIKVETNAGNTSR